MNPFVVISMTTVPRRNRTLGPTIASLLSQSYRPSQIRLYLTPGCEPVPSVSCFWTEDFGPLTKLSAIKDPDVPLDALVVTADDDQIYSRTWLEGLVEGAASYPDQAVGFSGWNTGGFLRDAKRGAYEWLSGPGPCDVLEGFAGVAYRKKFFGDDVWNMPASCRHVDDVWISGHLFRRGVARRVLGPKQHAATPQDQQGLHTRDDFVELNRQASRLVFGPSEIKLSICIPSLGSRAALLARLQACLKSQKRVNEVEILVELDNGEQSTGRKRNQLVAKARGDYVVHIDDDDLVADDYIQRVLEAIDKNPGVDAINIRGRRRSNSGEILLFDYGSEEVDPRMRDNVLWRKIGHLCPIRRGLAQAVRFPEVTIGEDLAWTTLIAPFIRTSARAGKPEQILYFYEYQHKEPMSHQQIFTPQYTESSGPGSSRSATRPYRRFLERFIRDNRVRSILDLGCGDMEVMSHVDLHKAKYLGVDVIEERVRRNAKKHRDLKFKHGDARNYPLDGVDLVIVKDVLQHWSNDEVKAWLDRLLASSAKMALVTNCNYGPTVNTNIASGTWRALDLTKPPFSIGEVVFRWSLPRGNFVDDKDVVLIRR